MKAQLFSLCFLVLLHAAQNANFSHTFSVPFLPSQASTSACPSLFLSSLSIPSGSWFCGLPLPNSRSALFPTLSPCNSRFFLQINPIFPFFLPSFSFSSARDQSRGPLSSVSPHPAKHIPIPRIFLNGFQPFLTQSCPPSSPFISQLPFLSPLSYQWLLVLIFTLLFFSLLFPFLSSTFRSSSFFLEATWIPSTSASSVEERVSCSCMHHWLSLPCGFCNGNDNDST